MVSALLDEKVKGEELPVGWPWRFFLFSILIAATACVVSLGLSFGYKPFLESNLARQDANITELGKVVSQSQQDEFIRFYSQLANLEGVLKRHVTASPFFGFLEGRTNAEVAFTSLEARVPERKVVLEGVARDYATLAEQLQAFSTAPEVAGMIVNDSSASDGRVRFRLTLTLAPVLFGRVSP